MNLSVEVYFPIVLDMIHDEFPFEQKKVIAGEIKSVLQKHNFKVDECIEEYKFLDANIIQPGADIIMYDLLRYPYLSSLIGREQCLKISISVDFNLDLLENNQSDDFFKGVDKEKILEELMFWLIADEFKEIIFETLLLSQIARPGSLKLRDGIIYIKGQIWKKTIPTFNLYRE